MVLQLVEGGRSWFVSLCSSLSDLHQLCTHKIADPVVFVSFAISVIMSDRRSLCEKGVILAQSSRYLVQRGGKGKVKAWGQSSWSHGIHNQGVEWDEHMLLIS